MSNWTQRDPAVWEHELHGLMLRVNDAGNAEQTDGILDALEDPEAQWVWRVLRADRFTKIELESEGEATREQAMIAAEAAACSWR